MIPVIDCCRAIIGALPQAAPSARDADWALSLHKTLSTARWLSSLNEMARHPYSWIVLLLAAVALIPVAIEFGAFGFNVGEAISDCGRSMECYDFFAQYRWISKLSVLFGALCIGIGVTVVLVAAQVIWLTATHFAVVGRSLPHSLWHALWLLPKAWPLGAIPLRAVGAFAKESRDVLQRIDVRWQAMILGRYCHFLMLTLIVDGTPNDQLCERARKETLKHGAELLDAIGTFNILFTVAVVGFICIFTGSSILEIDVSSSALLGIGLVLSIPLISGYLIMCAHFSRTVLLEREMPGQATR